MSISRSQIEAYFFGNPKSIANRILFVKRATRLEGYKQHLLNVQEFGNVWQGITGLFRGEMISIIVAGLGPSQIGDATYALDRPDSVCFYSGTCGGLQDDLKIGDYFIADRAICGDGYAVHFGHSPLSMVAGDFRMLESLGPLITARVDRIAHGLSFTTSSVVREVEADFWRVVNDKCGIIEMAAAAFYVAACASGKRAVAYFWVTDLPTRGKSFFDPLTPEETRIKQERYDCAVTLDLDLMSSL